ncbi:MAG: HK97 family phage prohead protease [Marinobacter sp.]|nr:HK97 family phage prohead protease [Marinobacter sp.]
MPAIPSHRTPTSDASWDGPANEARLKTDQDYSYYRRAYAWRDPDGDETKKSSYKFIHHEVDGDGNPGPANVRACITGIAVLNGARGGTTIPDADRQGVYNHLAAHLRDADVEPPELKSRSSSAKIEHRAFPLAGVEVRAEDGDGQPKIMGHAAVFNTLSVDLGFFREKIAPGAFQKTIKEADVRALWNHDPNYVLGRTKSRTLKLAEDDKGLAIEIIPPNTQWARDLMESIKRGDVDQMSFGFRAIKEEWEGDINSPVRVLKEVELFDVSPVTFPAYPATDVSVRSLFNILRDYLPAEPPLAGHSAEAGEDRALAGLAILRKRLEIAEKEI